MEGERISYHKSVRRVYEKIKKDGVNNIWDRYESQGFRSDPDSILVHIEEKRKKIGI